MKVNGNDPVHTYQVEESGNGISTGAQSNIPIRLELASRILAATYGHWSSMNSSINIDDMSAESLFIADRLIKTHNETCVEIEVEE